MKRFYLSYYNDKLAIICNGDFLDEEEIIEMLNYYYIDYKLYDDVDLFHLEPYPYRNYPLKFLLIVTGDLNRFATYFDLTNLEIHPELYPYFKIALQSYHVLGNYVYQKIQEYNLLDQFDSMTLDF